MERFHWASVQGSGCANFEGGCVPAEWLSVAIKNYSDTNPLTQGVESYYNKAEKVSNNEVHGIFFC